MQISCLIKTNLMEQVRNRRFLLILLTSIFLSFLCVPVDSAGYEIFWMGGVRGLYNSAWLGTLGVMLSTILLWLPGFYLLRSSISDDRSLKIGQLIAATPISKFSYITGKVLANFTILCILQFLFTCALMVMQLIRREDMHISILKYMSPLILIAIPYLLVLAVLTVLFDVVPFLQGTLGNILIFVIWVTLSSLSIALPGTSMDLFGIGMGLNSMLNAAKQFFPTISMESGSFGYYVTSESLQTFSWNGTVWNSKFLISRIAWLIGAALLMLLSIIIFDRFRGRETEKKLTVSHKESKKNVWKEEKSIAFGNELSFRKHISLFSILKNEYRILLSELKWSWKLLILSGAILAFIVPLQSKWIALLTLLPLPILSQAGTYEKRFATKEIVTACMSGETRYWSICIVNLGTVLFISVGIISRYFISGNMVSGISWMIGVFFIAALAIFCGTISEDRRLFEAIYIAWFYLGPINAIGIFDFLGTNKIYYMSYLCLAFLFILMGYFIFARRNQKINSRRA